MFERADINLIYDGTFSGFLCCMFKVFEMKKEPVKIETFDAEEMSLYERIEIETEPVKAKRIWNGIIKKMSPAAGDLILKGFLSCLLEKERVMCRFLQLGFRFGPRIVYRVDDDVALLKKAALHAGHEAHLFTGFIRFSERGGVLTSEIEPKNFVLPLLKDHFTNRFRNEQFFIYDKTHRFALLYQPFESQIIPVESFLAAPENETEREMRRLWKTFYDSIAIKERYNPRCRMSHMPKRYWNCMTEFGDSESFYKMLS